MSESSDIYCTSFCNKGHRLKTGRPVDHECYILPPAALKAEREGNDDEALRLLSSMRRVVVRGRK